MRLRHLAALAWFILAGGSAAILSSPAAQIHTSGNTLTLPTCTGAAQALQFNGSAFSCATLAASGGGGGLPAGAIVMVDTGTCPAGTSEVASLADRTLLGTLAVAANVGTTGGVDAVTPAGSVSQPSLTMNSYTPQGTTAGAAVSAHTGANVTSTFTGSALGTHAHELPYQIATTTTTRQIAAATFGTGTARAATAVSTAGTANTTSAAVALSQAVSGGTPAGTIANTVTQPAAHTVTQATFTGTAATLTGTVSVPTFTGTAFDNRSAFARVIFCRAD